MGAWNPRVAVAALFGILLFFATGGVVAVSSPDLSDLSEVLGWLEQLGSLDADTQRAMLRLFGQQMVDSGVTKCNVFGGRESCIELDPSSKFAHSCVNYPLKVDCAFYRGALAEQDEDPTSELEAEVEAQKATMCDGCNANLKDLYCAQTVPPCGSFQDHIELAIVPPLQRIVQGQIDGDNIVDAVAKEVPNLVKTLALVAPCRRYCEAITTSCGCGRKITIGQVLASNKTKNILPAPPDGISYEQLFAQVKDTPLCDLYADETEPGFSGHCPKDPNALIGDTCGWCSDNNEIPTFVEEHLGIALIDGVWGWLIGPEGLLVDAGFLSRDKNVPEIPSEGKVRGPNRGRRVLSFFLWLVGLGGLGVGAFFGLRAFRRFREERGGFRHEYTRADFLEEDEGEYTAAVDLDEL